MLSKYDIANCQKLSGKVPREDLKPCDLFVLDLCVIKGLDFRIEMLYYEQMYAAEFEMLQDKIENCQSAFDNIMGDENMMKLFDYAL